MKKTVMAILFSITLLFSACSGEPTLNTTDDKTLTSSIKIFMEKLSPEDQQKFQQAFQSIYMFESLNAFGKKSRVQVRKDIADKLNGKTVKEIIIISQDTKKRMKKYKK